MMKKILLIATGGTIASEQTGSGLAPRLHPKDLLRYVPDAESICELDTVQPFHIDSTNISPAHWLTLTGIIEESYDAYDGFVFSSLVDFDGIGIRPVVNLRSNVELSTELPSGCTKLDGTVNCPYIIK